MKTSIILLLLMMIAGCANQAFFSPKRAETLNQDIILRTSDSGNQIATLLLPATHEPQGIVLHFHGNSGHMEQTREKVDWLVEYGFDVWLFDYSGFGHSAGNATDVAAVADSIYMLRQLSLLRQYTGLPVYVIATSTGANLLIRALADTQLSVDGIIIDSGFTSYQQVARHVLEQYPLGHLYSWLSAVLMRDDLAAGNDAASLQDMPALVLHCVQDRIVPIEFGRAIYHALPGDKMLLELPDCRHARGMTREFPDFQQQVLNWLEHTDRRLTAGLNPGN
ncbi:alpha/beta hydrolase [Shewanella sp. GXUN23E]|uniref:alpha/beta hydrolase n=1 Tax=Shewanella sp. GXUN23E TaxID=3422498 RepID=UPI003D7EE062